MFNTQVVPQFRFMKNFFTLLFAALPFATQAQNFELGLSGGAGLIAAPSGDAYFKADQSSTSPIVSLTGLANLGRYSEAKLKWQVGLDISTIFKLQHESSNTYTYFTKTIGNDGKYFKYANYLLSVSPLVNARYPLSDVAYVYAGAGFGAAITRNSSNRKPQDFEGTDYTYTAPDGGKGIVAEAHAGITYRLVQRLALNAQVGFRYYNINFSVDDPTYPGGNSFTYNTTVIPLTIGIRYRMGWLKEYNSAKGRFQVIKEEIHRKNAAE